MDVQEAPLPAAFPVYAFLSLLGDLLLALLLVVVHGLLLAPRCVAAWARRRRGEAGPPPEPGCEFYQGTVTHTRLWPVFHTFTYPVRNVLVDLDAPPTWFARQKPDCLTAEETRQLAGTSGSVRLLTYAPSCGYQQNPISLYYCYSERSLPGAPSLADTPPQRCLAEVTNTPWGERCRFAFRPTQDTVPKPLHVSPFWHMGTFWRIAAPAPGEAIEVTFVAEQLAEGGSGAPPAGGAPCGSLFRASLKLMRVAPPQGPPQAWAWLMPHRVALWIYWQAALLLAKGVPFLAHPKYLSGSAYRARAAQEEKPLRRVATGCRPGGGCPAFQYREAAGAPWTWQ